MSSQAPVRISIIVPVYNVAPYLRECLDSLIHQTLKEIEIICVDDCSDDGSEMILDEYAQRDERMILISHSTNMSAAQSRKDGALASRGEFVLFVDPDDMLAENTCADLLALAKHHPADVIHFSASVLADESIPENRVKSVTKMLAPYKGTLRGDRLIDECFNQRNFQFQIWNKLFRGDLCRQAMAEFPDGSYPKAQDLMAVFIILFFARTYYGVVTEPYYLYRLGVGVTGGNHLSHRQIDAYAHQPLVVDGLKQFLADHQAIESFPESLEKIENQLTRDMLLRLRNYIAQADIPYAWETMCRVLGASRLIGLLAKNNIYKEGEWAKYLKSIPNPYKPRPAKCIGAFYHSLSNGGAQRVAATLTEVWAKLGYQVVIFTDVEPSEEDYPYNAIRVVLPDCRLKHTPEDRMERIHRIYEAVEKYHIDLFIYHAWLYPMLFWDILAIKSAGSAFYVHTHSVFSMPLLSNSTVNRFYSSQNIYAMADGVICLSDTDAHYYRMFNPRVFKVVNPFYFNLEQTAVSSLSGKEIIWVGRIANEKRPVQVIEIFSRVLNRIPDATLSIIGSGSEKLEEQMRKRADALGISAKVTFHGFQTEVLPFYQKADIFLCTSEYEGFSLTILEAQSCGLPVVTYDMPYLPILENNQGSVSVPQGDKDAAAEAIVELLTNDEYRHQMGKEARENIRQNFAIDLGAQWRSILESSSEPALKTDVDSASAMMLQTLFTHMKYMPSAGSQPQFFPLPKKGPFKKVRKKAATFLCTLLIQGFGSTCQITRDAFRHLLNRFKG